MEGRSPDRPRPAGKPALRPMHVARLRATWGASAVARPMAAKSTPSTRRSRDWWSRLHPARPIHARFL